jgi:hypothetical protein
MQKMKTVPQSFEIQTHRPVYLTILIPFYQLGRFSKGTNSFPSRFFTNIAQMPNLVRRPNGLHDEWHKPVMRICNHRDPQIRGHVNEPGRLPRPNELFQPTSWPTTPHPPQKVP